jgi:SAM-dependent methyltransferase
VETIKVRRNKMGFKERYKALKNMDIPYKLFKSYRDESNIHPYTYSDFECIFASDMIGKIKPKTILDVGSYRLFLYGLLANIYVTTVDIRDRNAIAHNETSAVCDCKKLDFDNNIFDMVLSLSSIEHFGLGRYGDEFDIDADGKAFDEMKRVVKPGGYIVFTTTINKSPMLMFNAHRIYSYDIIRSYCHDLTLFDERFFIKRKSVFDKLDCVTSKDGEWDVYCGCWKKDIF